MDPIKDLTPRQITILKAIIEEYISTAEPVGSETLDKKYNLGVSPATIRNEMMRLTDLKMLHQPHTSAGRSPTPLAMRYYVDHLMKTKDMSVADEVAVKDKIWEYRQEVDKLLREATKTLAEKTNAEVLQDYTLMDVFGALKDNPAMARSATQTAKALSKLPLLTEGLRRHFDLNEKKS